MLPISNQSSSQAAPIHQEHAHSHDHANCSDQSHNHSASHPPKIRRYTLYDVYRAMSSDADFNYAFWIEITLQILCSGAVKYIGFLLVVVVLFLISILGYSGFYVIIPAICEPTSWWALLHKINGVFYLVNIYFNYLMAVFTNPGSPADRAEQLKKDPDMDRELIGQRTGGESREDFLNPRLCKKCSYPKVPRSHHCSICNKCIDRMDHHCPYVSNCVGHRNYRYFFLFLMYVTLGTGYLAGLSSFALYYKTDYFFFTPGSSTESSGSGTPKTSASDRKVNTNASVRDVFALGSILMNHKEIERQREVSKAAERMSAKAVRGKANFSSGGERYGETGAGSEVSGGHYFVGSLNTRDMGVSKEKRLGIKRHYERAAHGRRRRRLTEGTATESSGYLQGEDGEDRDELQRIVDGAVETSNVGKVRNLSEPFIIETTGKVHFLRRPRDDVQLMSALKPILFAYNLEAVVQQLQGAQDVQILVTFALSLSVSIAVGTLFGFHLMLVMNGQTTIEFYKSMGMAHQLARQGRKFISPYNLGQVKNIHQVFGTGSLLIALLPLMREPPPIYAPRSEMDDLEV